MGPCKIRVQNRNDLCTDLSVWLLRKVTGGCLLHSLLAHSFLGPTVVKTADKTDRRPPQGDHKWATLEALFLSVETKNYQESKHEEAAALLANGLSSTRSITM